MPGAHRDLSMWKALKAEDLLKSFDLRTREPHTKVANYRWMVPNEFSN
jgi:hypothetical protein